MIGFGTQDAFHVGEISEIAVVRRAGAALGKAQGFDEVRIGQLSIVITEAATNIVKHASEGHILLRPIFSRSMTGVEILAMDTGPGLADPIWQMRDGNSTAGSYGVGLGAIERLSQEFDIYTKPDQGTVLRAALWKHGEPLRDQTWQVGSVCQPMTGETVCGDALAVDAASDICTWILADGLGHGPLAAMAAQKAVITVRKGETSTPGILIQEAHNALRGTRGAAVAIGQMNRQTQQLCFSGIGNIAVSIFLADQRRHLLSHNGIVGSHMRKWQEFCEPWTEDSILIAHSDGINTRWELDIYPGLDQCHPGIIAAVLYRDYKRGRDDAAVLVLRGQGAHP